MSDGSRSRVTLDDGMSRVSVTSVCLRTRGKAGQRHSVVVVVVGPSGYIYLDVLLSVIPGWLVIPRSCLLLLS